MMEVPWLVMLLVMMPLLAAPLVFLDRKERKPSAELKALVDRLGFVDVTYRGDHLTEMRGAYRGVAVVLKGATTEMQLLTDDHNSTVVTCTLPDGLPEGMSVARDHYDPLASALGRKDI